MLSLLTHLDPQTALALVGGVIVMAVSAGQQANEWLDAASWTLLAGVFTPIITSFVQQPRWTNGVRTAVGVGASLLIGILTLLANGSLNDGSQTVLSMLALIVVTSATAYKTLWVPSGIAPKIENATALSKPPKAPDPSGETPQHRASGDL